MLPPFPLQSNWHQNPAKEILLIQPSPINIFMVLEAQSSRKLFHFPFVSATIPLTRLLRVIERRAAAYKNIFISQSVWSKELNNFHRNNISAFAFETWRKHIVFQVVEERKQQSAKITILKCAGGGGITLVALLFVCKSFLQQCRCVFVKPRVLRKPATQYAIAYWVCIACSVRIAVCIFHYCCFAFSLHWKHSDVLKQHHYLKWVFMNN